MQLRVGIAGYGIVGKRRRFYIDQSQNMSVVAVCDQYFEKDGALSDGTPVYRNFADLITKEKLDVLFVCLINDVASQATIAGLEAGLHVFCEKPPGRNLEDIIKVVRFEQRNPSLKLKYGFNHRYHDSVIDALHLVRSGEFGKLVNIRGVYGKSKLVSYGQESNWRTSRELAGGGILLDQGIHMVDLLRLFAGEFDEIHSFISNEFWGHDVEDNAYALMKSKGGSVAMLHSTATQWRHRFDLDICLEKANITLGGILSSSKSYGAETMTVAYASEDGSGDPLEKMTRYNKDNSWKREVDEFGLNITQDTLVENGCSLDALQTMHLVYRIYCSDPKWKKDWNLEATIPDDLLTLLEKR